MKKLIATLFLSALAFGSMHGCVLDGGHGRGGNMGQTSDGSHDRDDHRDNRSDHDHHDDDHH